MTTYVTCDYLGCYYAPAYDSYATIFPLVRLSVCLFHAVTCSSTTVNFRTMATIKHELQVRPPKVTEHTMNSLPAPLQKHSLGDCTVDMTRQTAVGGHIVSPLLLFFEKR